MFTLDALIAEHLQNCTINTLSGKESFELSEEFNLVISLVI